MKRHIIPLLSFVFIMACTGQQSNDRPFVKDSTTVEPSHLEIPVSASVYSGPRYEIIQSVLAAQGTYRLDLYTGDVCQMQSDGSKSEVWHKLRRIPVLLQGQDKTIDGRPNYHLFLSTIAMRFTYLINVNTGTTWQLFEDQQTKEVYFGPVFER